MYLCHQLPSWCFLRLYVSVVRAGYIISSLIIFYISFDHKSHMSMFGQKKRVICLYVYM